MVKRIESYELAIAEAKESLKLLKQSGEWELLETAEEYLDGLQDEYTCLLTNDEELEIYLKQTGDVVREV